MTKRPLTLIEIAEKLISEGVQTAADAAEELRRLTPEELRRLGFTPTSRRYVRKSVKRPTKRSRTVSHRQYETRKSTRKIKGKRVKVSRERMTKLRKTGRVKYKTEQAKRVALESRQLRKFRRHIPELTRRDGRTMLDWTEGKRTTESRASFNQLFSRYPRAAVLGALYDDDDDEGEDDYGQDDEAA